MTEVVNARSLPDDWQDDPQYVYIGRGSPWGNRWLIDPLTRSEVIERYRQDVEAGRIKGIEKLRGKKLVCSCAPLPCHGEVLVQWITQNE
jgi:hypothetical protein